MPGKVFGERRHALEEAFFHKQNEKAVEHLRAVVAINPRDVDPVIADAWKSTS